MGKTIQAGNNNNRNNNNRKFKQLNKMGKLPSIYETQAHLNFYKNNKQRKI